MFKSVCDCCGSQGDLNVYILRIEHISNPSIAIRYDTRDAEVILPENSNCCYAMQNVAEPKFGEEPSYCDEYEEKEE